MNFKNLLLFFIIPLSVYAQSSTLKFDIKYEITNNDYVMVSDTNNHVVGKATGNGSIMFSDGTQGIVKVFFIYDYQFGNGDFTEYYDIETSDGSKLTVQAKGKSIGASNGTAPLFTGIVQITGGSGKYEGVYGTGSVTGNRNEALNDGAKVKLSFNITTK
jgi:hypothetical protein